MVQAAVMGYGVVGSGVVEVLMEHKDSIARRTKEEIGIKYILDIRDVPDSPFRDKKNSGSQIVPEWRTVGEPFWLVGDSFVCSR